MPTVHIDQIAGDSQAQTGAGDLALHLDAEEAFEQARHMLRGNADAIIDDAQSGPTAGWQFSTARPCRWQIAFRRRIDEWAARRIDLNGSAVAGDLPAFVGIFDGIVDDISHHLADLSIAAVTGQVFRTADRQGDEFAGCQRCQLLGFLVGQVDQFKRLAFHRNAQAVDARDVQDIVDQVFQQARPGAQVSDHFAALFVIQALIKQIEVAADQGNQGKRGAQFVGYIGNELILHALGLFKRGNISEYGYCAKIDAFIGGKKRRQGYGGIVRSVVFAPV